MRRALYIPALVTAAALAMPLPVAAVKCKVISPLATRAVVIRVDPVHSRLTLRDSRHTWVVRIDPSRQSDGFRDGRPSRSLDFHQGERVVVWVERKDPTLLRQIVDESSFVVFFHRQAENRSVSAVEPDFGKHGRLLLEDPANPPPTGGRESVLLSGATRFWLHGRERSRAEALPELPGQRLWVLAGEEVSVEPRWVRAVFDQESWRSCARAYRGDLNELPRSLPSRSSAAAPVPMHRVSP